MLVRGHKNYPVKQTISKSNVDIFTEHSCRLTIREMQLPPSDDHFTENLYKSAYMRGECTNQYFRNACVSLVVFIWKGLLRFQDKKHPDDIITAV